MTRGTLVAYLVVTFPTTAWSIHVLGVRWGFLFSLVANLVLLVLLVRAEDVKEGGS